MLPNTSPLRGVFPAFALARAAVLAPREIATVFPTSRALAGRLLEGIDWAAARSVVELGPGAGAITEVLLERMPHPESYVGLEINPQLARVLRARFPDLRVACRPAEELDAVVGAGEVDAIIASLPWTVFREIEREQILTRVRAALRPGGTFRTYLCAHTLAFPQGRVFLRQLRQAFPGVRPRFEWQNAPPAFVCVAPR